MTTTVDDFADLNVIGRFAQIFFDDPRNNTSAFVPTDSTIEQGSAVLDTDSRFSGFQLVTTTYYARDDHQFESFGGQQTGFVNLTEDLRLIARGGYDAATDPGILNIHAPMWSAGLEYTLNTQSKISVERGERFNHVAWTGDVHVQLSDKFFADGHYSEVLQPEQLQIGGSFTDFLTQATTLPTPLIESAFTINNTLTNQISLNKFANAHLVYQFESDTIDLGASWNDQFFLALNSRSQSINSSLSYTRLIAQDLNGSAQITYWRTNSNPLFGSSEFYTGAIALQYDINPTMRAYAGYTYSHQSQLNAGGLSIVENAVYAAITRRF